ncbi:MAG: hypothetical protein N2115_01270 [bacterium]|nr:hypothetical protein [bacterium]
MDKTKLKDFAAQVKADLIGIANIERFYGIPRQHHPSSILPEAKTVIVVGKRILRGGWRGVEEGTNWISYTYFDYHGLLNTLFITEPLYHLACFIEDHGYEAIPYYPGVPEARYGNKPLRNGQVAPDINLAIRIAGICAGLGEIGWSKVFLTEKFGPRQRLHAIITDLEFEPDQLVKPGSICTKCMRCVEGCPSKAIPHLKENKKIRIKIDNNIYEWADIHFGKCTLSYHGGDSRVSPFIHRDFPGWNIDASKQDFSEETAYKFCWTLSTGKWRKTNEFSSGYIIEGHAMIQKWGEGGSFGICGSRGCMRSCFDWLEKQEKIGQIFKSGRFIKRKRWLLPYRVKSK